MTPTEYVTYLITSLVSHPDDVNIEFTEDSEGVMRFGVRVNTEDMKYVIGRKGKTIRALQSVLRIFAIKQNKRMYLNLLED